MIQITAVDESGYPGELLAETTVPGTDLPLSVGSPDNQPMVTGEFETPAPVEAGQKYALVIFAANPSEDALLWAGDGYWSYSADPYADGMPLVGDNCSGFYGWWDNADLYFAVHLKPGERGQQVPVPSANGSTYTRCRGI